MRSLFSRLLAVSALFLGLHHAARADFSGDFAIVGPGSPAGAYYAGTNVPKLGQWDLHFGPGANISTAVDTGNAPVTGRVELYNYTLGVENSLDASGVILSIDILQDGFISFDVYVSNYTSSEDFYAYFAVSKDIHSPLTAIYDAVGNNTYYSQVFQVYAGEAFTFGVATMANFPDSAPSGYASNYAVVSNFTFTPIPEPSAFAMLAGLFALGCVIARRRRA